MRSVHGMHVHGFPNMFVLGHTQGGFTVNYPHLLEEASDHLCHVLRHAIDHDLATVEATAEGEEQWLAPAGRVGAGHPRLPGAVHARATTTTRASPARADFIGSSYGRGPMPFFQLLADWREAGTFSGLELRT